MANTQDSGNDDKYLHNQYARGRVRTESNRPPPNFPTREHQSSHSPSRWSVHTYNFGPAVDTDDWNRYLYLNARSDGSGVRTSEGDITVDDNRPTSALSMDGDTVPLLQRQTNNQTSSSTSPNPSNSQDDDRVSHKKIQGSDRSPPPNFPTPEHQSSHSPSRWSVHTYNFGPAVDTDDWNRYLYLNARSDGSGVRTSEGDITVDDNRPTSALSMDGDTVPLLQRQTNNQTSSSTSPNPSNSQDDDRVSHKKIQGSDRWPLFEGDVTKRNNKFAFGKQMLRKIKTSSSKLVKAASKPVISGVSSGSKLKPTSPISPPRPTEPGRYPVPPPLLSQTDDGVLAAWLRANSEWRARHVTVAPAPTD
nr:hypothetical protein CFP56_30728 [Quercus suber]